VGYSIDILRPANKMMDKLSRSQPTDAAAIEDAIEALADDPRPPGYRPLKGHSHVWRIRVGDYRICYTINDGQLVILVVTVSTRDDVYQMLRRYLG
jgi:mRNA interferase RelE/StbE